MTTIHIKYDKNQVLYDRFEMVCRYTVKIIQNEIRKHIRSNDINASSFLSSHILAISVYYEKHKPKLSSTITLLQLCMI